MEQIALGYDGSPAAHSALQWVATRAGMRETRIVVAAIDDAFTSRADAETSLADAESTLRELAPTADVEARLVHGAVLASLMHAAEDADMLAIGVHRDAPVRSALTGFLPLRVSMHSPVPVCLVPDGWQPGEGAVVVGYTDDDTAQSALEFAAQEARAAERALRVVHTWQPGVSSSEHSAARHEAVLRDALDAVTVAHPDLDVDPVLLREDPAAALVRESTGAALLVIGTHHHGVWTGGLLGSVAWYLIGELRSPLCVVPTGADGR